MMNMSHKPTFENPGFADIGVKLNDPLIAIHECMANFSVSPTFTSGIN